MIILSEYTDKNKKVATDSSYLDTLDTYKSGPIYQDIAAAEQLNSPLKKLEEFTKKRINLRTAVSNGSVKGVNAVDAEKTNRIAAINDLYRGLLANQSNADGTPVYNIDKLSNPSYSGYIKDPDFYEMVKYEVGNSNNGAEKLSALENYVEKGGYPTKVFDYLTSPGDNVTNPYGINEKALREQSGKGWLYNKESVSEAEEKWGDQSKNVAAATFLSKPFETALGLANLGIKGLNKAGLSDWIRGKQYKEWDAASTDEYNQYKQGKLSKDSDAYKDPLVSGGKSLSRVNLYDEYDKAKSMGFDGSVEEYANYKKDMDKFITDIKIDEGQRLIDKELIDTNKAAIATDVGGEIAEAIMFDWALRGLGIFKGGEVVVDTASKGSRFKSLLNVSKQYGKELLKNISNFIVDTTRGSVVPLTIESAKQGELPTRRDATVTSAIVAGLEALVRLPGMYNFFKNSISDAAKSLYRIPENAYEAIGSQTPKQWAEKLSIAEQSFGLHPKTTPKQEIGTKWNVASKNLKASLREQEANLKELRQNIKGTTKPQDIIKPIEKDVGSLNGEMTKLTDMGELSIAENKVPVFDINEKGVMEIHNKDTLNVYKSQDGVGLGDAIEKLWNDTFANGAMKQNTASADAFVTDLEKLIKNYDLSGSTKSNALKDIFVDWINMAKKTIRGGMDSATLKAIEEAEAKYAETRQLEDAVDKYILGTSSNSKYLIDLKNTEIGKNVGEGGDIVRIIAEKLKKGNFTDEDLIAETVSYAYALALKDPQAAAKLIEEIYPSAPGLKEYFLQSFRRKALEETSKQIVKGSPTLSQAAKTTSNIWNDIKSAVDRVPLIGGVGSARSMSKRDEKSSNGDIWAEEDLYSY